jgi:O-antigen/teichoic acid export membrane protein
MRALKGSHRLLKSGLWSYVETGSGQIFSAVTLLYIARTIGPEEFGVVAVAAAWAALLQALTEAGIGDAIIQRTERSDGFTSTAFWLNFGLAIAGMMCGVASALWAPVEASDTARHYLAVLCLGVPVMALGNIPTSLLRAELRNKDLARRGIMSDVAGSVVGIGLASMGLGGWAIIVQNLVANSVKTAMVWRSSGWLPGLVFDRDAARGILRFGYKSLGAGLLSSISARTDRFVLGHYFPAREVGIFSLASEGVSRLSAVMITGLSQVMFPHYASLQKDREALAGAFYKSLFWCCLVGAGAFSIVYAACPLFAHSIVGEKWVASIPILQVLTVLGMMQCTLIVPMTLYKSAGRPGIALLHSFIQVVANIALIAIFRDRGLFAIAVALAARPFLTILVHVGTVQQVLPGTKWKFVKSILPGVLTFASVIAMTQGLRSHGASLIWVALLALVAVAMPLLVSGYREFKTIQR